MGPQLAAPVVLALLVAGCANQDADDVDVVESTATGADQAPQDPDQRFRGVGVVLEGPGLGPQLCTTVAEPNPPRCQGIDIAGWDWTTVEAESFVGTTWGSYVVVGTWAAETSTLTLTEPAVVDDGTAERAPRTEADFSTPCPEPAGGWRPVDPARATQWAMDSVTEVAEAQDGFAGVWIGADDRRKGTQDPLKVVVNVATTGDRDAMERSVREVWGGALCVSEATGASAAELEEIREVAMAQVPDVDSAQFELPEGHLVLWVPVATAQAQRDLDAQFGDGVVRLTSILTPVN